MLIEKVQNTITLKLSAFDWVDIVGNPTIETNDEDAMLELLEWFESEDEVVIKEFIGETKDDEEWEETKRNVYKRMSIEKGPNGFKIYFIN